MKTPINPKLYVAPGTGFHSSVGWTLLLLLGPIIILFTILITYGIALIVWIIAAAMSFSRNRKALAQIKGSAVRVDEYQFPEIFQSARSMAQRIGLSECPDIYIIEDNKQNAFAVKHGSKRCILLIDDIVYGALATGNRNALSFIIAHELAHHALGHTHYLRRMIASKYWTLSRLDELSCDAVANALIADVGAARDALALLLIGPQLFQSIDKNALERQAQEVKADSYSKKSEARLTHPLLLRRYAALT